MNLKIMNRRDFLRTSGAAAAGAAGALILVGCRRETDFDLLIKEVLVVDGSGRPPYQADVGIRGKHIQFIGKLRKGRARRVIEAGGLCLSPGFIDVHNHTDVQLLVCPTADSLVRQGITTVIGGNCGASRFPLTTEMLETENRYLREELGIEADWQDLSGFFGRLAKRGIGINYATLVGQGTVRAAVVGYGDRQPSAEELSQMKDLVRQAMKQGAVGISTGLEYAPGSFASTGELIELISAIKTYNGIYATHMRDEEDGVLDAVEEAITIAEKTGVSLEISHLKVGYPRNWDRIDALLEKIDRAAERRIPVAADVYPYTAFATGLSIFFPIWVREGKKEDFLGRLRNPELQPDLREAVNQAERNVGTWDKVLISSVRTEKNRWLEGLNLLQASVLQGKDVFTFIRDLLLEEEGQVSMVCFAMSEHNLRRILKHPLTCLCTDGELASTSGPLFKGKPHPRYYGSFPRALAEYVRKEQLMPLEEMVRKMTSAPAEKFGLLNRGRIKEGYAADLVLFDIEKIQDKATWSEPHQFPEGLPYVAVNGRLVVDGGQFTGKLPGEILSRG
ncbi:MAG: D-aminoacylase [Candidatus Saccharicenans sp.]|nr:D-aminoacylase [Candidatus Saccharicenans sp.]MDI6849541.1 D-aminoacylase [Candidatus Saccharicenans sp.]